MICDYCDGKFKSLNYHANKCKDKKRFNALLYKRGIIERGETVHVSGGMKIFLFLRGDRSNKEYGNSISADIKRLWDKRKKMQSRRVATHQEDLKWLERLSNFEKRNKCRLEYDFDDDRLWLEETENVRQ